MDTSTESKSAGRAGLILFLAALALYGATLPGTIQPGDGPELTVAACRLGIPHPSGYPTWTLAGRLFSLLPFGSPALRINLFAALAGAGAVGLLAAWLVRVSGSFAGAAIAGAALATSFTLWSESTGAEVYSLSALFLALVLTFLPEGRDRRRILLSAYLWGLALSNHLSLGFLLPAFLIHGLRVGRPDRRTMLLALLLFLLGLSPYLYLPVRASLAPIWNWGDPSTLDRLLIHLTGYGYWGYLGEGENGGRFFEWAAGLGREMTWLVWIALPAGLWMLRAARRDLLLLVAGASVLSLGYTLHFQIHDPGAYFLPVYVLFAIPIAFIPARLSSPVLRRAVIFLLAAAVAVQAAAGVRRETGPARGVLDEYVANILETVEPGGIVVVEGDAETFGAFYAIEIEGRRRDVSLWNPVFDLLPAGPAMERHAGPLRGPGWKRGAVERALHEGVPVYTVSESDAVRPAGGYRLQPWGILFRYLPAGRTPEPPDYWSRYRTAGAEGVTVHSGYLARIIAASYPIQEARERFRQGREEEGRRLLERAARVGEGVGPALNNVALAWQRAGDGERAEESFRVAEDVSRDCLPTLNLARLLADRGETEEAADRYRRVIDVDPRFRYTALLELGRLMLREGSPDAAFPHFLEASAERSGEAAPLTGMGESLLLLGEVEEARVLFQRADGRRAGAGRAGDLRIAGWYEERGRLDEADDLLSRLLADNPGDAVALERLAFVRASMGKNQEADSLFEAALAATPDRPPVLNAFAWSLAERRRDLGRALDLVREARNMEPSNRNYADTEGWVLARLGRYDEAILSFEEAIAAGHTGAGVRYRCGFALLATGREEEGRFMLEEALHLDPESADAEEAKRLLR